MFFWMSSSFYFIDHACESCILKKYILHYKSMFEALPNIVQLVENSTRVVFDVDGLSVGCGILDFVRKCLVEQ